MSIGGAIALRAAAFSWRTPVLPDLQETQELSEGASRARGGRSFKWVVPPACLP